MYLCALLYGTVDYVSTVTDVGLMCHLLCVIHLPFVVSLWCMCSHDGCDLLCLLLSHGSLVHCLLTGPLQLTLWGYVQITGEASLLFLCCLSTSLL